MDKWIIEADIYRYRKELADLDDGPKRQRQRDCLSAAEAVLARHQVDELALETSPDRQERDHFARRAAELRTMAQGAADDEIRRTLEAMAVSYEELVEAADRAARIRSGSRPSA